jgi:hypothetical protein
MLSLLALVVDFADHERQQRRYSSGGLRPRNLPPAHSSAASKMSRTRDA